MKIMSFIFLMNCLLFLGCEANKSDSVGSQMGGQAVNLSESEGCADEKNDKSQDEITFSQSSATEDVGLEEEKKNDSGCSL